jgi:hypothetical protein
MTVRLKSHTNLVTGPVAQTPRPVDSLTDDVTFEVTLKCRCGVERRFTSREEGEIAPQILAARWRLVGERFLGAVLDATCPACGADEHT